jgi:THO complex subunit 3
VCKTVNLFEVNELQFSQTGFLFVAAGHPAGYGTFEVLRVVPDKSNKKNPPSLENVHKDIAHSSQCFALDLDPRGRYYQYIYIYIYGCLNIESWSVLGPRI